MMRFRRMNCSDDFNIGDYFMEKAQECEVSPSDSMGSPKQCFTNAMRMVLYSESEYDYVEGYNLYEGFPIEHAWVIDRASGEHLDCTIEETEGEYLGLIYPKRLIEMVLNEGFCEYRGSMYDTICSRRLSREKLLIIKSLLDTVN